MNNLGNNKANRACLTLFTISFLFLNLLSADERKEVHEALLKDIQEGLEDILKIINYNHITESRFTLAEK